MKKISLFSLIFILSAFILAACSGRQAQEIEPVKYTLEMTEYAFSPVELQARVGQEVTIELLNSGQIEHEFMVGREVKQTNNRPDGYEQSPFTGQQPVVIGGQMADESGEMGGHGDSHSGFMVILPEPGEKATVTFTPTRDMAGEWEIGCFSQDGVHYDAGMKARLVISP